MRKPIVVGVFCALALGACSAPQENASETKYELLSRSNGAMPHVTGSSFHVCVSGSVAPIEVATAAVNSARTWLSALSQQVGGRVTTNVIRSCPGHVNVTYQPSVTRAHAFASRYPQIYVGQQDIYRIEQTMLHEFGHAFGLGDTYVEGVWSCKPGQPESVMCKGNSTSLAADDIHGIVAVHRRTFGSNTVNTGSNPPTSATSTSSQAKLLDCNADFLRIRQGGSGVCDNASSGFCYRYGGGAVLYNDGPVSCNTSSTIAQSRTTWPRISTISSSQVTSSGSGHGGTFSGTTLKDCNDDYTLIRTGRQSGVCLNRSSGFCYRYHDGSVLYHIGHVPC